MRIPKYRRHKASGRATIQWKPLFGEHPHYLPGKYGSEQSRAEYQRIVGEILKSRPPMIKRTRREPLTITRLCIEYAKHAAPPFYTADEFGCIKGMTRVLIPLFGSELAADFGPLKLDAVRQAMIDKDWSRNYINSQTHRLRRMFRWAVSKELIDAAQLANLAAVPQLREGKTAARETEPVEPVPWEVAELVLPYVSPIVATMARVQYLTAMRSDELTGMMPADIDMRPDVWVYEPQSHKTEWRGKTKLIAIGPQAIELCKAYLPAEQLAYFFSPAASVEQHRAKRAESRKTPHTPSSRKKLAARNARSYRPRFTSDTYRVAIMRGFTKMVRAKGCTEALPKGKGKFKAWLAAQGIEYWHPHQLRHTRGTLTKDSYGSEGTEAQLGDSPQAAKRYAEKAVALALRIARETG